MAPGSWMGALKTSLYYSSSIYIDVLKRVHNSTKDICKMYIQMQLCLKSQHISVAGVDSVLVNIKGPERNIMRMKMLG